MWRKSSVVMVVLADIALNPAISNEQSGVMFLWFLLFVGFEVMHYEAWDWSSTRKPHLLQPLPLISSLTNEFA